MMTANNLSGLPMPHHSHAAHQWYPYSYDSASQQQAAAAAQAAHLSAQQAAAAQQAVVQQAAAAAANAASVSTASGRFLKLNFEVLSKFLPISMVRFTKKLTEGWATKSTFTNSKVEK